MMHLFGVLRLHAVSTHEGDSDTFKKLAAHRIGEVEHFAVVISCDQFFNDVRKQGYHFKEGVWHTPLSKRVLMQRRTEFDMLSKGTTTSEIRPGSQYAASSKMITSPATPLSDW